MTTRTLVILVVGVVLAAQVSARVSDSVDLADAAPAAAAAPREGVLLEQSAENVPAAQGPPTLTNGAQQSADATAAGGEGQRDPCGVDWDHAGEDVADAAGAAQGRFAPTC
jgi:hypothetical protein